MRRGMYSRLQKQIRRRKMNKKVLIIRKSCLTGKIVWIYSGVSRKAGYVAYHRACEAEIKRTRKYAETSEQRKRRILKMLNDCLAEIPITVPLTKEQTEAARELRSIAKEDIACHREFYEHIIEERRRRKEDKTIREKMKERSRD